MTITRFSNNNYQGLAADTKPTNVPSNSIFYETDTGKISLYNGTSWDIMIGNTKTETLTNKTIDADGTGNSITNIENADIKTAAGITTSKLADSANFAMKNVANTFTEAQTVSKDALGVLTLKRPSSSAVEWGINFDALNSASATKTYAVMKAGLSVATAGAEDGYIAFQAIRAGTLVSRLLINNNGNLFIGTSPTRAVLDIGSIATSDKTFTFPNLTGNILTDNSTATLTNKILGTTTMSDAANITLNTTTGTKIGTATTQKLGFYNATPVVQPAANVDTSGATLVQLETEVNELKALLRSLGLMAA